MLFSYKWLKSYFEGDFPAPEKITETITMHAFEIESVEEKGDDFVLDVKILPNRAHDCLCHEGIAREVGALIGTKPFIQEIKESYDRECSIDLIIETDLAPRVMFQLIENVHIGPSPAWLKEKLEVLGQRSISNVVDITNYVMQETGQPMHAFDAGKLVQKNGRYSIGLKAVAEETPITTLGGKEYKLPAGTLVFTDENGEGYNILDIAGTKGGVLAEVDEKTTSVILTASNFNPAYIRKFSRKIGIQTDATKRSENGITPELAVKGITRTAELIREIAATPEISVEKYADQYPHKQNSHKVSVSVSEINRLLGTKISEEEVSAILGRFGWEYEIDAEKRFVVTAPAVRLDLRLKEDLIEDIGRIYGYDKIPTTLPEKSEKPAKINKLFYYSQKIRNILASMGFDEVQTYAFQAEGEVELENPLASDKGFLRSDLSTGLQKSLELNAHNAELLGLDEIKIFEIGTVFSKESEDIVLGVAVRNVKKDKVKEEQKVAAALADLFAQLGTEGNAPQAREGIAEISLMPIVEKLPDPKDYFGMLDAARGEQKYKAFSQYPFVLRDIAVWVAAETPVQELEGVLVEMSGPLLAHSRLFDTFTKENDLGEKKTSYAFRLVFQSSEKTLSDDEVNEVMNRVNDKVRSRGWEVR